MIDRYQPKNSIISFEEEQAAKIRVIRDRLSALLMGPKSKSIINFENEKDIFCERVYAEENILISTITEQLGSQVEQNNTFVVLLKGSKKPPVIIFPPPSVNEPYEVEAILLEQSSFYRNVNYNPRNPEEIDAIIKNENLTKSSVNPYRINQLFDYVVSLTKQISSSRPQH